MTTSSEYGNFYGKDNRLTFGPKKNNEPRPVEAHRKTDCKNTKSMDRKEVRGSQNDSFDNETRAPHSKPINQNYQCGVVSKKDNINIENSHKIDFSSNKYGERNIENSHKIDFSSNQYGERNIENNKKSSYSPHHHRQTSFDDNYRMEIARETMKIISDGYYYTDDRKKHDIKKYIYDCVNHTCSISDREKIDINSANNHNRCQYEVVPEATIDVARRLTKIENLKTCVLNFASATKPGGGFLNGRQAQEECLARQTCLYESIKNNPMYHINNEGYPQYTDNMIYSPNVPVIRDGDDNLIESFPVSIITSPAVNASKMSSHGEIKYIMTKRCEKIIALAAKNNREALVLGAFGCGVFGNDPEVISGIFKELLINKGLGNFFKKIVFAIKGSNIVPFQRDFMRSH